MMSRSMVSRRRRAVSPVALGAAAYITAALALSAPPSMAAECPNEQVRQESAINPTTDRPYSLGLPDCRAYEMVSPVDKQSHDALPVRQITKALGSDPATGRFLVAPDGEAVGFDSEGAFADPENFDITTVGANLYYLSRRGATGWVTSSTFPPASLVNVPYRTGLAEDFSPLSPSLSSTRVDCGGMSPPALETNVGEVTGIACATRNQNGSWRSTPTYLTVGNASSAMSKKEGYLGASVDMSRVFIQPAAALQLDPLEPVSEPLDTLAEKNHSAGIYEIAGVDTASPVLRLVNVASNNTELIDRKEAGNGLEGPLLGDRREDQEVRGSAYHAISESGGTVFFTAIPHGEQLPHGEQQTVYARVRRSETEAETIAVSNPPSAECPGTTEPGGECSEPAPATFQGASADGSKVFFTTSQKLVQGDTDATNNLYEYDFSRPAGHHVIQISGGVASGPYKYTPASGARILGVVRTSSDGSHVYFVAFGKLTTEPSDGKTAQEGQPNLYGYDTETGETKFIAVLGSHDEVTQEQSRDTRRTAQTTPDGRYLVFSSHAQLAGDENCPGGACATTVYLYEFETGELTWISHAAPGLANPNEGDNAIVSPLENSMDGASADVNNWNRAISGESEAEAPGKTPEERHDGEYIIFTTSERLQGNDVNNTVDVYEWHGGVVSLISDGRDRVGVQANVESGAQAVSGVAGMSASGSDIVFGTHTRLVGQDGDVLEDIYDARIGGGFPAPVAAPSCSGDSCQGPSSSTPSFQPAVSSLFAAGGNLIAPATATLGFITAKPKPLTRAQKLARALKACRKDRNKRKRRTCESRARRAYGKKVKAKKKVKPKKSGSRGK